MSDTSGKLSTAETACLSSTEEIRAVLSVLLLCFHQREPAVLSRKPQTVLSLLPDNWPSLESRYDKEQSN